MLSLLSPPAPAGACVGTPPPPVCGKNLTLALAGPPSTVLTGGGIIGVSALVYFALLDFPQGFGICPVGPYTVDVSVIATCSPGPNGSGQVLSATISPGFNTVTVPVTIPSGPARQCTLSAIATVILIDGMTLTETADNVLCVVDPAAGGSLPRLDLELLGAPGTEIARTHPGDQAAHVYRITNNDDDASFAGGLTVDMLNEARMPGMSGPAAPGTGVFSISDPVQGDNFGIAFEDDLFRGCVALPPDPLDSAVPEIDQAIDLGPGESTEVTIFSRHWGMCADGSCGRSTVTVDGAFSDTSQGLACSGFVLAADSSVPPDYGWPDAGEVGEAPMPDDPSEPKLELAGEPVAGVPIEILTEIVQAALQVDGQPAGAPIVFADRFNNERGRVQFQFLGDFVGDVDIDFDGEVLLTPVPPSSLTVHTEKVELLNGPTGFAAQVPSAAVQTKVTDPLVILPTSFFDIAFQISVVGIDNLGARRPFDFGDIQVVRKTDGSGLDVVLGDGFLTGGPGADLLAIEATVDLHAFLSSELQGSAIFEDGFESGNVFRWSVSTP